MNELERKHYLFITPRASAVVGDCIGALWEKIESFIQLIVDVWLRKTRRSKIETNITTERATCYAKAT